MYIKFLLKNQTSIGKFIFVAITGTEFIEACTAYCVSCIAECIHFPMPCSRTTHIWKDDNTDAMITDQESNINQPTLEYHNSCALR